MDSIERASDIVKRINQYYSGEHSMPNLIEVVCCYFNDCSLLELSQADLKFLRYIANEVGLPQYFDMLKKFSERNIMQDYNMQSISDVLNEIVLFTSENVMLHKYQKQVFEKFDKKGINKYFLSASTSFGKTFLVYEIIKEMKYKNVLLVFPTIALLSENLERILLHPDFKYFRDHYNVHTTSDTLSDPDWNCCILTPERYLSFIDNNSGVCFDFSFVDEVYKIDNEFELDERVIENERDIAYRIAMYYILKYKSDILLVGPYIKVKFEIGRRGSFMDFLAKNEIAILDYNQYEIVNKEFLLVPLGVKKPLIMSDGQRIDFQRDTKGGKLKDLCRHILSVSENMIVYCSRKAETIRYAKEIMDDLSLSILDELSDNNEYNNFCLHLENRFSKDWVVVKALRCGIGIHNGLIPKYIQKEIVALFNKGVVKILLSTTTITEGVNTTAKNLIVMDSKKGLKTLKKFDAKNISGRAGRFMEHFSGRVFVVKNDFMEILEGPDELLKHKNYELDTPKGEIDVFITDDEYLNQGDNELVMAINEEQNYRDLPDDILVLFKVVSKRNKIKVYDYILDLNIAQLDDVKKCISHFNWKKQIIKSGFQIVIDCIKPIVLDASLIFLLEKKEDSNHSRITGLLNAYLRNGMHGMIDYQINLGNDIDKAIKETTDLLYNTFKYKMVKYLGVFDLMFRYRISQLEMLEMEDVHGFTALIKQLEYNASTDVGRLVSDYGVPQNVLDKFEGKSGIGLDSYEQFVFEKVNKLF